MGASVHQPEANEPASENGPMEDPAFLESPVSTLVDSLTSPAYTPHDLIDAYTTLTFRLSTRQDDAPLRALDTVRAHARVLAQVIRHDVLRAAQDPLAEVQMAIASGSSTTALELRVQALQNEVAVCHAALQLVSLVFQSSRLTSLFRSTLDPPSAFSRR
jgi:hypothetical protein